MEPGVRLISFVRPALPFDASSATQRTEAYLEEIAKIGVADCAGFWQVRRMLILLLFLILVLTTIWVGIDSHRNQIPVGNKPYSGGNAILWMVLCVVWIAFFPVYLVKRAKTLQERNPAASAPVLASVLGGLSIVVVLFCVVGMVLWGTGIKVVEDQRSASQATESKQENPAQNAPTKDATPRQAGNDHTGTGADENSGQATQPSAQPKAGSPEDRLRARLTKNIEDLWRGDPDTRNARVKTISLTHENGNEYTGAATADFSGQEKKFPFRVTYDDAHDNLSMQMGEEQKRMSDDELRDDVRQTIEKKWAENPAQKDIRTKSITLARQSGNEYAGILIADVSGREEKHSLKVTYDGSHYSYVVGDPPLSLEELRGQVSEMIEKKWRENPASKNVHLISMTLSHQSGIEYVGIVTAKVSGQEKKLSVHVHYDGNNWTYEVE